MLKVKDVAYLINEREVGYIDVYVHDTDKWYVYKEPHFVINNYSDYKVTRMAPMIDVSDELPYLEMEIVKKRKEEIKC